MSGSKRWYKYIADGGSTFAVELDNTNSVAILSNGSTAVGALADPITGGEALLPGRLKMRYVNAYLSSNPIIKRRFWVPKLSVFNQILSGATIATAASGLEPAGSWVITSRRGEKAPIPTALDTGQVGP